MMSLENLKRIINVLNDLIKINKEREEDYGRASRDLTPAESNLRGVFERKAEESRNHVVQLEEKAEELKLQGPTDATEREALQEESPGIVYEHWNGFKDGFKKKEEEHVLESCVKEDDAVCECYKKALSHSDLPDDVHNLLQSQKLSIDASQQEMRNHLRNISNKPPS